VFSAAQMIETAGVNLGHEATSDTIAGNWSRISDYSTAKHYVTGAEQVAKIFERLRDK
jgi:hypothetical protein